MACYTGTTGALEFDSNSVAKVTSWTVTHTQEVLDDTVMGNTYRSFCAGLKTWEGSAEVIWTADEDDNSSVDEAFTIGSEATLTAYWDDNATPANDLKVSGTCIITSIEYSSTVGELATATVSFQGTDTLTVDSTTAS